MLQFIKSNGDIPGAYTNVQGLVSSRNYFAINTLSLDGGKPFHCGLLERVSLCIRYAHSQVIPHKY